MRSQVFEGLTRAEESQLYLDLNLKGKKVALFQTDIIRLAKQPQRHYQSGAPYPSIAKNSRCRT
ncbi:hypothetical protein RCO48_21835 [Peribacillus frigoritolerans]|nr:hypothetical protein [Peribacillus frigoritolerans]